MEKLKPEKELVEMKPVEVSIVDDGANAAEYFFVKNAEGNVELKAVDDIESVFEGVRKKFSEQEESEMNKANPSTLLNSIAAKLMSLHKDVLANEDKWPSNFADVINWSVSQLEGIGASKTSKGNEDVEKASKESVANKIKSIADNLMKLADESKETMPSNFNSVITSSARALKNLLGSDDKYPKPMSKSDSTDTEPTKEDNVEKTTNESTENPEEVVSDVEKKGSRMAAKRLLKLGEASKQLGGIAKILQELYTELGGVFEEKDKMEKEETVNKTSEQNSPVQNVESDVSKQLLETFTNFEKSINEKFANFEKSISDIEKRLGDQKEEIEKVLRSRTESKSQVVDATKQESLQKKASLFANII